MFSCESENQNRYFRTIASQHHKRGISAVFVMVEELTGRIAGYYALSMHQLEAAEIPEEVSRSLKLPKRGVLPAALIGQLARDSTFKGEGIGELLVTDAYIKTREASKSLGCVAVVVDADGATARQFWTRLGFIALPAHPDRLFLPMATVTKTLAKRSL